MICLVFLKLIVLLSAVIFAKDAPQTEGAPAELQLLAWTTGVWDTTATCKSAPDAPAVKARSIETVRWSANRQFPISDQLELLPVRKNQVVVTTWNLAKREYDLTEIHADGEVVKATMGIEHNVEKFLCYYPHGGRLVRIELVLQRISSVEYRFYSDCTDQGKTWRFCEGTSKKRE
ncbi:MAG: hypothetical protein ACREFF_05885 [Candidatus Udaeobacter sp.]